MPSSRRDASPRCPADTASCTADTGSLSPSSADTGPPGEVVPPPCPVLEGSGCIGWWQTANPCGGGPGGEAADPPTADTGTPPSVLVGGGGGGACAVVDPGPWVGLTLLLLWWMRRGVILGLCWVLGSPAGATDVSLLQWLDGGPAPGIVDPTAGPPGSLMLQVGAGHAANPVRRRTGDSVSPYLVTLDTVEVGASIQIMDWFRVGASLPTVLVRMEGDPQPDVGLGDRTLFFVLPLGEGTAAEVLLDLSTPKVPDFAGETSGAIGLVTDRAVGPLGLAARGRIRFQLPESLPGVAWGPRLEWALSARTRGGISVGTEVVGSSPATLFLAPAAGAWPVEWIGFARLRVVPDLHLGLGVGAGLTRGLGASQGRVLANLAWAPRMRDSDQDGYRDLRDLCPRQAEDFDGYRDMDGCPEPDNDRDTYLDAEDGCPLEAEVFNDFEDEDGCPDALATWAIRVTSDAPLEQVRIDIDGDGAWQFATEREVQLVPGDHVLQVEAPGHRPVRRIVSVPAGDHDTTLHLSLLRYGTATIRLVTTQGTPLPGHLRITETHPIPDTGDQLRLVAGAYRATAEAEGYLPSPVRFVVPVGGDVPVEIPLEEEVFRVEQDPVLFRLGSADLQPTSLELIDTLVAWLVAHPEVHLLRVEGHADAVGSPAYNYDLSQRRARAVVDALTRRGIDPDRLDAVGSGEAEQVLAARPPDGFDLTIADVAAREVTFAVIVWDEAPGVVVP